MEAEVAVEESTPSLEGDPTPSSTSLPPTAPPGISLSTSSSISGTSRGEVPPPIASPTPSTPAGCDFKCFEGCCEYS
jgi:hypothetical protein